LKLVSQLMRECTVASAKAQVSVVIMKDGPYIVSGDAPLHEEIIGANAEGESIKWRRGRAYDAPAKYALCRCGQSGKAPFCDGTHARVAFDGTETAARTPYAAQAQTFDGPALSLLDARYLCADARFCDPNGKVWTQVARTDDLDVRAMFLSQVHNCPAGRLVAFDNATGDTIEQKSLPAIGLIEDPVEDCSGPIWLRGAMALISADGHQYESRNNMTVCRCGASRNKPFCDGTHSSIGFRTNTKA
jgi:CDGSH-type Zn-finger protein